MNPHSVVVQQAPQRPEQLMLMFHGVGATAQGLVPLGQRLASAFPLSTIVSIAAPHRSGNGGGEWFSVAGITESNRVERVAQAMPAFLEEIASWQRATHVTPAVTALVGFSQGAIMALEASIIPSAPAARVVAIAGRFAALPTRVPPHVTFHLVHGKEDAVIPYRHAIDAAHRIRDLNGDVTADVLPFANHEINAEVTGTVLERLQGHVPKRVWDEALRSAPTRPPKR